MKDLNIVFERIHFVNVLIPLTIIKYFSLMKVIRMNRITDA